ncbi:MAG: hypothetical protein Ct9H90mP25_3260 [Gammaproteobacteria bacterium]|nr:MAG: hypothetical protein Ct9H90mP25_3260 [Gammaproteobacteria bacterium]
MYLSTLITKPKKKITGNYFRVSVESVVVAIIGQTIFFGNRVLYGPERNQFYSVFDAANEGREDFIAMYIITRGNRRVYAYFEFIEPGGAESRIDIFDSDTLLSELQAQRSIVLKNIDFESDLS